MLFDPENPIVKLCTKGMELEGEGRSEDAKNIFYQAWDKATNASEKFIAAHYIARHQPTVADKLTWDKKSLELALGINDEHAKAAFPSLYLNIAKCFEDMGNNEQALENYRLAESHTHYLNTDGYGNMVRAGIQSGIMRVSK